MRDADLFLTIAEVAVAFAGFASLVGILGQRSSRDDPRVLGVRMRGMILFSLLAVAFSLVPFAFHRWVVLLGSNAFRATPVEAAYVTGLLLLLFLAGFAFTLILFSFLPSLDP